METPLDELASAVERLREKVNDLESRLAAMEHRPENMNIFSVPARPVSLPASHPVQQLSVAGSTGTMASIGKVFLGLAGAYVLRAVAESGSFPQLAVAGIAIVYAATWLFWSARAQARFPSVAYGITAALIIFPLLWEVTVRFRVLPSGATAAILFCFVLLASLLAWKQNLAPVAWVTTCFAAATALGLLVATRNPVPYAVVLLLVALVTEIAAWREHWTSLRPVVAFAADLSMLALLAIYTRAEAPEEYVALSAAPLLGLLLGLQVIYTGSTVARTVLGRRTITYFESAQTSVAFVIATVGVLRATHDAAAATIGAVCFLAAAACYLAAFTWFDEPASTRNHYVYATWGAALLLEGIFLAISASTIPAWLCVAALVSIAAAVRTGRLMLALHALIFGAIAGWTSGLLAHLAAALAGAPARIEWQALIAGLSAIAIAVYAWRFRGEREWPVRAVRLVFAAAGLFTFASFAVSGIALVMGNVNAPGLAVLRTVVACVLALACGLAGARYDKRELIWLAYAAVGLCTLKLLVEDFRHGNAASLAASLFLYGMVWLLLPRLARTRSPKLATEAEPPMSKRMAG